MRKIRRFNGDDDSYVEGTASSLRDDTEDQLRQDQTERMAQMANSSGSSSRETPAATPVAAAPKPQNFKSAFAEARSAGDKTFEFNGKKYTTDLAKNAPPPKVRETTVKDVFPVLTGEKKRAEEKMDKKQFRAEQNAQIIAREAARAKAKAAEEKETMKKRSDSDRETQSKPVNERFKDLFKVKESEKKTPKRAGNLTDMVGLSSRYASGGSVSASNRGDGIAQRGKTRGKMC